MGPSSRGGASALPPPPAVASIIGDPEMQPEFRDIVGVPHSWAQRGCGGSKAASPRRCWERQADNFLIARGVELERRRLPMHNEDAVGDTGSSKFCRDPNGPLRSPRPHAARADVRDHVESQEGDHRASYASDRGLQKLRQPKTDFRKIWGAA